MSRKTVSLCLAAAIFAAFLLRADEAEERRMGDDALRRLDYANAVQFYRKALSQAGTDAGKWNTDAIRLARALLRSGDVDGARTVFAEFSKRNGASADAGLFPGELLLAEKRYMEAAEFFERRAGSVGEAEERDAMLFAAGEALATAGEYRRSADLYRRIEAESSSKLWRQRAHLMSIESLISGQNYPEAAKLLTEKKYSAPGKYAKLELYYQLCTGEPAKFRISWNKQIDLLSAPDRYQLAIRAAARMQKSASTLGEAVWLLQDASEHAPDDYAQRAVLRDLINLESVERPAQAVKQIRRYLKLWPESRDRAALQLREARLLAAAGESEEAEKTLLQLIDDSQIPHHLRLTAAREAARIFGETKNKKATVTFLGRMRQLARNPGETEEAALLSGEYFFRERNFAEAEKFFRVALAQRGLRLSDVNFMLLQTLMAEGKLEEAVPVAKALSSASQGSHRAAAAYFQAEIAERKKNFSSARTLYLNFIQEHPGSEYLPGAIFHAAELAFRLKKYQISSSEFLAFADRFSKEKAAPEALFLALRSSCAVRNRKQSESILSRMDRDFLAAPATREAHLFYADFLRSTGNYEEALKFMAETGNLFKNDQIVTAENLYSRAQIARLRNRRSEALELFNQVVKEYPAAPVAGDAAFRAGDLLSDRGDYPQSLVMYRKALELSDPGILQQLCQGRIADTLYVLFGETLDLVQLREAENIYTELTQTSGKEAAGGTTSCMIRLQSLCKLGKCAERGEKYEEALNAYDRTLYYALELQRRGISFDPVWPGKAALAILRLNAGEERAGAYQHSLRVLEQMKELKLCSAGELAKLREDILQNQQRGE